MNIKSLATIVALWGVTGFVNPTQAGRCGTTGGHLQIFAPDGQPAGFAPLRHTDVTADITGWVSRVHVKQIFYNPLATKIEAVYVFPLPQHAAVDEMTMTVGDRRILGQIKPREEARRIYDAARAAGHVAGLLDQERPNIFMQSVANIEPGVEVVIEISYVETLDYHDGRFEFVFPMVVGPRYIPGGGSAPAPMTTGQPTPQVPDAHRITPPVTPEGTRAGHDISLTVNIDAGTPIATIDSELHTVDVNRDASGKSVVRLTNQSTIPNKDFILRYNTQREEITDALFLHTDPRGMFFTLMLQPPQRVADESIVPREIVFVLDTSGSMSGFPIEKAKDLMTRAVDAMRPGDAFNIITFAGDTRILWEQPRPNTQQNRADAKAFLAGQRGGGGTEMMKAINAALVQPCDVEVRPVSWMPERPAAKPMRVVCFMTDGYVGNDMAIVDAVQKNAATTRVFSFGIGNSVNRFLLDGMARAGRGEAEYVSLQSDAESAVARFANRIAAPVLADIELDWGSLDVTDVHPARIDDLFSAKPIMVHGRLRGGADGTITLRGRTGNGRFERSIPVRGSDLASRDALPSLWARAKVEDLMMTDYAGFQNDSVSPALRDAITALGVDYRLMTQFTSFVAVEEQRVTEGGQAVTVLVPVEMPDGVSYDGVFGERREGDFAKAAVTQSLGNVQHQIAHRASGSEGFDVSAAVPAPPPAPSPESSPTGMATRPAFANVEDELKVEEPAANAMSPRQDRDNADKLAPSLVGLSDRVVKDGINGDLTVGSLVVKAHRVAVRILLRDATDATLDALKQLGFVVSPDAKPGTLLDGSIDVRMLRDVSKLDVVLRIEPSSNAG